MTQRDRDRQKDSDLKPPICYQALLRRNTQKNNREYTLGTGQWIWEDGGETGICRKLSKFPRYEQNIEAIEALKNVKTSPNPPPFFLKQCFWVFPSHAVLLYTWWPGTQIDIDENINLSTKGRATVHITCQYFITTQHLHRYNQHLGHRWVQRKLHHVSPQRRQAAGVVQSSKDPQLVHRVQDVVLKVHTDQ